MNITYLEKRLDELGFPKNEKELLKLFFQSYMAAYQQSGLQEDCTPLLDAYLSLVRDELSSPTPFAHFHLLERRPFDFYSFGLSLVRPLIDLSASRVYGEENLRSITNTLSRNENVILLANHQTEIDPHIISILVEPFSKSLASSMVFVAGHRVTSDPLAIPFSRGRNLICIYSKKYIDFPPEEKPAKLLHNSKSLAELENLLHEGGICVYVAPSGGRDRWDEQGNVQIAPFDPQSVEMFHLLSKKAKQPTSLHLLSLATMHLMPPPKTVNIELGETREVFFGPARLFFGPKLDFESIGESIDRKERRLERSEWMTKQIEEMYQQMV
jgi:glycerol-3-phosphate O-acyltransferase